MKGIMFNEECGLETAVLNGTKTRTWRADKQPRYEVGEIVAIKQCYKNVSDYFRKQDNRNDSDFIALFSGQAGWKNKMFVKNEMMPHQIRITAVKKCRLQDLTDEECLREGIYYDEDDFFWGYTFRGGHYRYTPKTAFIDLITKLNGKNYWESNPDGYAYEFELVK